MPIIFSTTTPTSPACQPPARIYFEAPDDALLARVTEKVAERMGRHLSYTFHDEAPGGVTPIILEDVGPSAPPVETTVVNYPHAAGVVPGSLLLKEYPSELSLTDNGRGHLIDLDGRFAAMVDYETRTIHQPQALSAASPTPPAEQQAQPGAVYAELPAPTASIGTDDAWHEAAMRDFADRTHAARLRCKSEQARLATLWGYVRADAAPSAAVFGLRLVPVEPTDQMVQAAHHIDLSYMPGQEGADRAAIYRAMIAAAPQPALDCHHRPHAMSAQP